MPYASRRQRRSTFFITYAGADGPEIVRTLAYPGQESQVKELAERQGYKVLGVSRTLPRPADGGFRIDTQAVNEVIEFLGIKLPVKFKIGKSVKKNGSCCLRPSGGSYYNKGGYHYNISTATALHHEVFVSEALTAEKASHTIWHELVHAVQAERVIDRLLAQGTYTPETAVRVWHKEYRDGTAYAQKAQEREANEYADAFAAEQPVARSRRPTP